MKKAISTCIALATVLAGCTKSPEVDAVNLSTRNCNEQTFRSVSEKANCIIVGERKFREVYRYPDLMDRRIKTRIELARRRDKGEITVEEAFRLHLDMRNALLEEELRRDRASLKTAPR